jgi:hypothetical protein
MTAKVAGDRGVVDFGDVGAIVRIDAKFFVVDKVADAPAASGPVGEAIVDRPQGVDDGAIAPDRAADSARDPTEKAHRDRSLEDAEGRDNEERLHRRLV